MIIIPKSIDIDKRDLNIISKLHCNQTAQVKINETHKAKNILRESVKLRSITASIKDLSIEVFREKMAWWY